VTSRRVNEATYPTVCCESSAPAARVTRMACSAPASSGSGELDAVRVPLHELGSDALLKLADSGR
jgi:hypothetical protein